MGWTSFARWWRWRVSHPRPNIRPRRFIHKLGRLSPTHVGRHSCGMEPTRAQEPSFRGLSSCAGNRARDQVPIYDSRSRSRERGTRDRPATIALGEDRSKGRGAECRSNRVANLGNDVGSCRCTCVDYGLAGASGLQRIGTNVVDADSSPVTRRNDGHGAYGRVP